MNNGLATNSFLLHVTFLGIYTLFAVLFILSWSKAGYFYILREVYNLLFQFFHLLAGNIWITAATSQSFPLCLSSFGRTYTSILPSSLPWDSFSTSFFIAIRIVLFDLARKVCVVCLFLVQASSQLLPQTQPVFLTSQYIQPPTYHSVIHSLPINLEIG